MTESRPPWQYTLPGEWKKCRLCGVMRKADDLRAFSDGAEAIEVCRDEVLCDKWQLQRHEAEAW